MPGSTATWIKKTETTTCRLQAMWKWQTGSFGFYETVCWWSMPRKASMTSLISVRKQSVFGRPISASSIEPLAIQEGPNDFNPIVVLYFDPRYQVVMESVRLRFFERHQDGLHPVDPVDCHIEILKA